MAQAVGIVSEGDRRGLPVGIEDRLELVIGKVAVGRGLHRAGGSCSLHGRKKAGGMVREICLVAVAIYHRRQPGRHGVVMVGGDPLHIV